MKYNFGGVVGRRVSIAIDFNKVGLDGVKETYTGTIKQYFDDFIVLEYEVREIPEELNGGNLPSKNLDKLVINKEHIISIWIYK